MFSSREARVLSAAGRRSAMRAGTGGKIAANRQQAPDTLLGSADSLPGTQQQHRPSSPRPPAHVSAVLQRGADTKLHQSRQARHRLHVLSAGTLPRREGSHSIDSMVSPRTVHKGKAG